MGEVVHQSSPSKPQVSQPQLNLAIRDLIDAQLREVLDVIQLETARSEEMVSPCRSPLGQWHGPVGGVDADLDNGEVILQGRGMGT